MSRRGSAKMPIQYLIGGDITQASAGLRSSTLVQSEQERRGHHARWDSGAKRRGTEFWHKVAPKPSKVFLWVLNQPYLGGTPTSIGFMNRGYVYLYCASS